MSTTAAVQTIYPALRYRDAEAAIEWLGRAFGFTEKVVYRVRGRIRAPCRARLRRAQPDHAGRGAPG